VLLKFVVKARKAGYKLFAMNLSPHHQKIFKMVEMSRFMPTIEERDLAAYR
jgi:anti-anti-sigma regulatory factor